MYPHTSNLLDRQVLGQVQVNIGFRQNLLIILIILVFIKLKYDKIILSSIFPKKNHKFKGF